MVYGHQNKTKHWGKENQITKTQTVCLNTFIIKHFSYGL